MRDDISSRAVTFDGIATSHFLKWAKPLHDEKSKLECGRLEPL
jgi:hypothetical protein